MYIYCTNSNVYSYRQYTVYISRQILDENSKLQYTNLSANVSSYFVHHMICNGFHNLDH